MTIRGLSVYVSLLFITGLCVPFAASHAEQAEAPQAAAAPAASPAAQEETVFLNMRSKKYHNASCQFKKLCTKCVPSTRTDAKSQGLEACKVCGG